MSDHPHNPSTTVALRRDAALHGAVAAVALLVAVLALDALLDLGTAFAGRAMVIAAIGGSLLYRWLPLHAPQARVGVANRITLVRAVATVLVLAAALEPRGDGLAVAVVLIATAALLLDGLDGAVARRRGESSAFGARFDMETDALLILALAVTGWRLGHAGAWLVLAGALRYLFVLAGAVLPWMRRPLPPSQRRRVVCVVQTVTLLVCVSPWPGPPVSTIVAAAGLAALVFSFTVDTLWLAARAGRNLQEEGTP